MSETTPKKKLTTTQAILIVGIVLVLLAVVGIGLFLYSKNNEPVPVTATPGTGNLVADDDFDPNAMIKKAAENMFEIKMNSNWFFADGTSPAQDAYIANSTANDAPFYVDIILKDTEEIIYTSPIIGLGSAVKNFTLSKDLEAGDYDCICRFNILAEDKTVEDVVSVTALVHIGA